MFIGLERTDSGGCWWASCKHRKADGAGETFRDLGRRAHTRVCCCPFACCWESTTDGILSFLCNGDAPLLGLDFRSWCFPGLVFIFQAWLTSSHGIHSSFTPALCTHPVSIFGGKGGRWLGEGMLDVTQKWWSLVSTEPFKTTGKSWGIWNKVIQVPSKCLYCLNLLT